MLHHVPRASRTLWAQALTRSLAAINAYNSEDAWLELLMLPKTVLLAPPRGGRKNAKAAAAFTSDRLTRWLEGHRMTLWSDVEESVTNGKPSDGSQEQRNLRRAAALAAEGFDRKACGALLSKGTCEESVETVGKLRELHPTAAQPTCPPMTALPGSIDISPDMVEAALYGFPRDSAAGPSLLRAQHLIRGTDPCQQRVFLRAARRDVPQSMAPYMAGAALMALVKDNGGVRPIAVGEVFRRLVGKCLCASVKEDAQQYFHPLQVGVATPLGVEAAVHSARSWMQRAAPGKGLLKLDFRNALNIVSRDVALQEVRHRFPTLARWTQWCYASPAHLQFGQHRLASETGVQQGDPLGPLLYAAALHRLATVLANLEVNGMKLDMTMFYLDDGALAGDLNLLAAALQCILAEGPALGLHLNIGKSVLVLPGEAAPDLQALFPAGLLVGEGGVSRVACNGNFDLLRAAVGDRAHCEAFARRRVQEASELMHRLPALGNPQMGLRLLRECAGYCKVLHSMRRTPPGLQQDALNQFDSDVRMTFCNMTGLMPSDTEWLQATRGLHQAGLGLRSASVHAPAAYLSSRGASADLARALDNGFGTEVEHGDFHRQPDSNIDDALAALNQHFPQNQRFTADSALASRQRAMSHAIDAAGHEARLMAACPEDRATMRSECEPGARALWQAIPNRSLGLALEPAEFICEVRQRLCMADCAADRWCPLCDAVVDRKAHHPRTCAAGGDRVLRHNGLRNFIFRRAAAAGLHPELEKAGLPLPARPPTEHNRHAARRRPADVYLPTWTGGAPAALDFAVTAPQKQGTLAQAAERALAAATEYSNRKREHQNTEDQCRAAGVTFVPMVAETTGAWAPEAMDVLRQIAVATAATSGRDARDILKEILQGAAVCIRRASARAELRRARDDTADGCAALHAARAVIAAAGG